MHKPQHKDDFFVVENLNGLEPLVKSFYGVKRNKKI